MLFYNKINIILTLVKVLEILEQKKVIKSPKSNKQQFYNKINGKMPLREFFSRF